MKRCVVMVSAFAVLAVGCSAQDDKPAPAPAPSTQRPPAPEPAAHVGETLNLMRIGEQEIAVTLTDIINPATVPHGWGDPGKTYIATKLTIANTGTTTIVGNGNSDVVVIGSDNRDYRADFATVTECKDFTYGWFLLAAGAATTGCVVFALPPGVTPAKIEYRPSSGISRDVGRWLAS